MAVTRFPLGILLHGCVRSVLQQGSWNFERMQNLGFIYQLLPGLRRIYGPTLPAEVLQRHTEYFNTHPYMATWVAGTVLRLEEKQAAGEAVPLDAAAFRSMVMAPYAAMGDALFWGGLRPLAAVAALLLAIHGEMWAPLLLLVMFNVPHLVCRCSGWLLGYRQELASAELLQRLRLPDAAIWLKEATIVLLGILCALLAARGCEHQELAPFWGLILLPVILFFAWLSRRGVTSFSLVVLITASLLGLALIF
ncbi:MAG: PTS mannose/fructose/sorbose transporter family subunit IID [Deltaproteobacteria bacterium]|nr:MAG: PTS mannose/fructose/sorbose transporter family subunit IID [Deltaproteobacteria bacterium]